MPKTITYSILHVVTAFYLLIGCSLKDREIDSSTRPYSSGQASFVTGEVKVVEQKYLPQSWPDFPEEVVLIYKTCLKDLGHATPIINRPFEITSAHNVQQVQTDEVGCLRFQEMYSYNRLAPETFVENHFSIKGTEPYRGEEKFIVSVLNALDRPTIAYDSRFYSLPEITSTKLLKKNSFNQGMLNVQKVSFEKLKHTLQDKRDKRVEKINFTITPTFFTVNRNGEAIENKFSQETPFNVEAEIYEISEQGDELSWLSSYRLAQVQLIDGGNLKGDFIFEIDYSHFPDESSNISIIFKVIPAAGGPWNLGQYIGQVTSENIDFRSHTAVTRIQLINKYFESFTAVEKEKKAAELISFGPDKEVHQRTNLFDFRELKFEKGTNIQSRTNSSQRELEYSIKACLFDPFNSARAAIKERLFDIYLGIDENIHLFQTGAALDDTGCVKIRPTIVFDDLSDFNKDFRFGLIFKGTEGNLKNEVAQRQFWCNPTASGKFCQDEKFEGTPIKKAGRDPEIYISKIEYKYFGTSKNGYYINNFLQLFMRKKFTLETDLFYQLNDVASGENFKKNKISYGQFDIEFSMWTPKNGLADIRDPYLKHFELVMAHQQKNISPRTDNRLVIDFEKPLTFNDSKNLALENLGLIRIIPHNKALTPKSFRFSFYGSRAKVVDTYPIDFDFEREEIELINQLASDEYSISKVAAQYAPYQNSVELYRAKLKDLSKFDYLPENVRTFEAKDFLTYAKKANSKINDDSIKSYLQSFDLSSKKEIVKLCPLFFSDAEFGNKKSGLVINTRKEECINNPDKVLSVNAAQNIIKINSKREEKNKDRLDRILEKHGFYRNLVSAEEQGSINKGVAFFAASGNRFDFTDGTRTSRSRNLSYNLYYDGPPNITYITMGKTDSWETYHNDAQNYMEAKFSRIDASHREIPIIFEKISIRFSAHHRNCFLAKNKDATPFKIFYVCQKEGRDSIHTESWHKLGASNIDDYGLLTNGLKYDGIVDFQFIRGEKNFRKYWKGYEASSSKEYILGLYKPVQSELFQSLLSAQEFSPIYNQFTDNAFPGIIWPFKD